jgi:hypothetical protein
MAHRTVGAVAHFDFGANNENMKTQLHMCSLRVLVLVLFSICLLEGCAPLILVTTIPLVVGGARVAADPSLELGPKDETNRVVIHYPIQQTFSVLLKTVEQNGRKIVATIPAGYSLRVSYPFSFLANNWGGVITIACLQEGSDTTVTILGSGRDPNYRVKKIGDEILREVSIALEQMPKNGAL